MRGMVRRVGMAREIDVRHLGHSQRARSVAIGVAFGAIFGIALFAAAPAHAAAPPCRSATEGIAWPLELDTNVEYVNGFVAFHLKMSPSLMRGQLWRYSIGILTDECYDISTPDVPEFLHISITPGVQRFSVRFTSPTHYEIWNDEANIRETCSQCSGDLVAYPAYYEVFIKAVAFDGGGGVSTLSRRIRENAPDAPVREGTLPRPPACDAGIGWGYLFDSYERAEYVNGLLQYHFRLLVPYNDGRTWQSGARLLDETCHSGDMPEYPGTGIRPLSRYFSVRFSSPTHYDIWNDETNEKETCSTCSIDIPAKLRDGRPYTYFSYVGVVPDSQLISTAFPIEERRARDPVLIVPGLLGSWLHNGEWELEPILHSFDNLWNALKLAGYEDGTSLFFLGYDFAQSNVKTAEELKQKIAAIKAICNCPKVDVIAHSMGGLVARQYAQSDDYANDIDQLIFLGTPHLGAPKAYLAWEGGEMGPDIFGITADTTLARLFRGAARRNGFANIFDYIHGKPIASLGELLPIYDYLVDESNSRIRSYPDRYPQNPFLENLDATAGVERLTTRGIRVTNIAGDIASSTVGKYVVVDSSTPPKWSHGFPNNFYSSTQFRGMLFEDGDKTVPLKSAGWLIGGQGFLFQADHTNLITSAQQVIIHDLTGKDPTRIFDKSFLGIKALFIEIFSPITIMITDPRGRRIGFENGEEVNQIPDAFYTGPGEEQFIVIPDAADGAYGIDVTGTGSGEYSIMSSVITDTSEASTTVNGMALPDAAIGYELNISSTDATTTVVAVPKDTLTPTTTASVTGGGSVNGWYLSNVDIAFTAADNDGGVGVARTEYSFDGGMAWLTATSSVPVEGDGIYRILYRSIDLVGNREEMKSIEIRIDAAPPEAVIRFDPDHRTIRIEGIDVASTTVSSASLKNGKIIEISDEAEHKLSLNFSRFISGRTNAQAILNSITYEGKPPIAFKKPYVVNYGWSMKPGGGLRDVIQNIAGGGKQIMRALYSAKSGKTIITAPGSPKRELPGLVLIRLGTNNGAVNVSY